MRLAAEGCQECERTECTFARVSPVLRCIIMHCGASPGNVSTQLVETIPNPYTFVRT